MDPWLFDIWLVRRSTDTDEGLAIYAMTCHLPWAARSLRGFMKNFPHDVIAVATDAKGHRYLVTHKLTAEQDWVKLDTPFVLGGELGHSTRLNPRKATPIHEP